MRYGIITDLHSNIESLEAVLAAIEKEGIDAWICLGDIVGYGANPNEVTARVIGLKNCKTVIGNHDVVAIGREHDMLFNSAARQAIRWTAEKLSPEHKGYLNALPYTISLPDLFLCHSSPDNPKEWYYLTDEAAADYAFSYFNERICLIGHTHIPRIYAKEISYTTAYTEKPVDTIPIPESGVVYLEGNRQFIINIGSTGQPRDGDNRACGGVLDMATNTFKLLRVSYDIEKAGQKIKDAGLNTRLADRLHVGR